MTPSPIAALPFWISLSFLPMIGLAATLGGLWLLAVPVYAFVGLTLLDAVTGHETRNPTDEEAPSLFWYGLITWIWLPIQLALIWGQLGWIFHGGALSTREGLYLMLGSGIVSGGVGIVYAHELMHRPGRLERALGEVLMISVLYGHFVTEHIAVHHRHVGTPKDAVTARYNESFYMFFLRVLPASFVSAWRVEAARMRARGLAVLGFRNPFWRYLGGAALMLAMAYGIGGWAGLGLYLAHAFVAVLALEQVNYMEHYGLVRKHLGGGRFEPTRAHHSWNASHRTTNYMLINLQRHSDHHVRPDKRFPVLRTYTSHEAPQLPFGYPLMALMTFNPYLWRRVMNPRVRRWRSMYYPEIVDWSAYTAGTSLVEAK